MITPLRRRHRWLANGALTLAVVGLWIALRARPTPFVELARGKGPGAETQGDRGPHAWRMAGGLVAVGIPGDDLGPDLVAYGVPAGPPPTARGALPEGAFELGPKEPGVPTVFSTDRDIEAIALYSVGHGEVKAWLALEPAGDVER